jgi:hypothetical protein
MFSVLFGFSTRLKCLFFHSAFRGVLYLSDEDAIMWFWSEKEICDSDENKEEESDDETVFPKKCSKCGSALVWREDKRKWVCPTCK